MRRSTSFVSQLPGGALPFAIEQRYYLDAESHLLRGLATSARGKHPENGRDFTVEMRGVYRPAHHPADLRR